jgi:hypothetical protein
VYQRSVLAIAAVFVALGLTILASTLVHGGGPLSVGTLLGLAFIAVGAARVWMSGVFRGRRGAGLPSRRGRGAPPRDRARGQSPP